MNSKHEYFSTNLVITIYHDRHPTRRGVPAGAEPEHPGAVRQGRHQGRLGHGQRGRQVSQYCNTSHRKKIDCPVSN